MTDPTPMTVRIGDGNGANSGRTGELVATETHTWSATPDGPTIGSTTVGVVMVDGIPRRYDVATLDPTDDDATTHHGPWGDEAPVWECPTCRDEQVCWACDGATDEDTHTCPDLACPTCGAGTRYVATYGAPGIGQAWECTDGHHLTRLAGGWAPRPGESTLEGER
jgi:hypothetical protein